MLEGTRPIDLWMLVIELLVLAVICAEGAYSVYRHYHTGSRAKRLFSLWEAGQQLQVRVPTGNPVNDENKNNEAKDWNQAVVNWENEVINFLRTKCSNHAVTRFRHYVVKPRLSLRVTFAAEALYIDLESKLDNLHSIMEKPDVYF